MPDVETPPKINDDELIEITDLIHKVSGLREICQEKQKAVRQVKKQMKTAYREYFEARDELFKAIDDHKENPKYHKMLTHFRHVDESDLYYRNTKRKLDFNN